jgi:hypothetical protein
VLAPSGAGGPSAWLGEFLQLCALNGPLRQSVSCPAVLALSPAGCRCAGSVNSMLTLTRPSLSLPCATSGTRIALRFASRCAHALDRLYFFPAPLPPSFQRSLAMPTRPCPFHLFLSAAAKRGCNKGEPSPRSRSATQTAELCGGAAKPNASPVFLSLHLPSALVRRVKRHRLAV